MYTVYVIYSERFQKYYTGQTQDITKRLYEHNQGTLVRYTKNKGPWLLVYSEEYETRSEALKREKYLKTGVCREFIKMKLSNKNLCVPVRRGRRSLEAPQKKV